MHSNIQSLHFNFKVGLSFQKELFYLLQLKPFKIDKQFFLFHFKSSFCFQDIQVFVLTFLAMWKKAVLER